MRSHARSADRRPIVIVGGRGTLGSGFARICAARGQTTEVPSRQDLDITRPGSIEIALERLQPWAVVNAAGYVCADRAENEVVNCWRTNATGPSLLADACRARDIRLVTFSSDLVFDGRSPRPYVESDGVAPLGVYGRSKAESEELVLARYPDALVIRTSAFFGPWDRWNILHLALAELAAGRTWAPEVAQRVSPTYVPDLVHATLDLLIDGAAGIWHLVNAGDVSWSEFVRTAAELAGYPGNAVSPRPRSSARTVAPRPAYSVLGTERGQLLPPLDDAIRRFFAERLPGETGDHGTAA